MRSVLDFYRRRPAILVLVLLVGIGVAVGTTAIKAQDAVIAPLAFVVLVGIGLGAIIGAAQRRDR